MKEPDVAITDFLLAIEATAFAVIVARTATGSSFRSWFIVLFGATAVASLAGGVVHGFPAADRSVSGIILWRLVLLALGVASTSAWAIGARLVFGDRLVRLITAAAWIEFVVYAGVVVLISDAFVVAIINYLPSTVFLVVAMIVEYRADYASPIALGLGGLVLTLIAAVVQRAQITLHPTYFNHNALYHLLQAIALFLIFRSAMFLISYP